MREANNHSGRSRRSGVDDTVWSRTVTDRKRSAGQPLASTAAVATVVVVAMVVVVTTGVVEVGGRVVVVVVRSGLVVLVAVEAAPRMVVVVEPATVVWVALVSGGKADPAPARIVEVGRPLDCSGGELGKVCTVPETPPVEVDTRQVSAPPQGGD
jgi:hypothetical protein